MSNSSSSVVKTDVRQALERARNCEDGHIDSQTSEILESAIGELWKKIQSQPDTYVLDRDEFALFNFFRDRFRGSSIAQMAVERFWNNYQGSASNTDGSKT